MTSSQTILDARACERTLRRMADEIVERTDGTETLVLVGIQRRGVQLAARLASLIEEREVSSARPLPRLDGVAVEIQRGYSDGGWQGARTAMAAISARLGSRFIALDPSNRLVAASSRELELNECSRRRRMDLRA